MTWHAGSAPFARKEGGWPHSVEYHLRCRVGPRALEMQPEFLATGGLSDLPVGEADDARLDELVALVLRFLSSLRSPISRAINVVCCTRGCRRFARFRRPGGYVHPNTTKKAVKLQLESGLDSTYCTVFGVSLLAQPSWQSSASRLSHAQEGSYG